MKRVYPIIRHRVLMLTLSGIVIIAGIVGTILQGGFNLGIDFQAGLDVRVAVIGSQMPDAPALRDVLSELGDVQVQSLGDPERGQFQVRLRDPGTDPEFRSTAGNLVVNTLQSAYGTDNVEELGFSYVGPRFSASLARNASVLILLSMLLILAYIWFRFRFAYAISAIAALVHDIAVMIGVIGAVQIEVSTATIAAVLTVIGYSLNDTIVIFDRVRENEGILREESLERVLNVSITQSLSRTIITSLTTLLAVASIFVFTTGQIRDFALNLMIGVVVGTYSSIFIAAPTFFAIVRRSGRRAATDADTEDADRKGLRLVTGDEPAPQPGSGSVQMSREAQREAEEIIRRRQSQPKKGGTANRSRRKGRK